MATIESWRSLFYYKRQSLNKIASHSGRGVDAVDGEGNGRNVKRMVIIAIEGYDELYAIKFGLPLFMR